MVGRRTQSGVAGAEDALELVGGRHLELIVTAIVWPLVRPPAQELRGVAEARALHVIVRDLTDSLGSQRLPAQVFAAVPPARRAGSPLPGRARVVLRLGPVAPWMAFARILTERRQLGDELLAHRVRERRGDADVV